MDQYIEERNEQGFTLIELLIAIVVVGILTAVAIVGIAGLTNNGKTAACSATADAVKAAQAVYYSNNQGVYPANFDAMLNATPPDLELSGGASRASATEIDGSGWVLKSTSTGTDKPLVLSSFESNGTTALANCV